jgi:hypothetical protein
VPVTSAGGGGNLVEDLLELGPAPGLFLREDDLTVECDVQLSTTALGERGVEATRLLDLGRQTGGPGQVVSGDAVRDLELHVVLHE